MCWRAPERWGERGAAFPACSVTAGVTGISGSLRVVMVQTVGMAVIAALIVQAVLVRWFSRGC